MYGFFEIYRLPSFGGTAWEAVDSMLGLASVPFFYVA